MKVAVIGSRSFDTRDFLFSVLDTISTYEPSCKHIDLIISGGAAGADKLAELYAAEKKIPLKIFLPEYEKYGRSAPLKRNLSIVQSADLVVAFWDGESRGTKNAIDHALKLKKKVVCINSLEHSK
jgi:hypothetical protein